MIWEKLVGAAVDGRFRLCTLTYAGREQAEFVADPMGEPGAGPITLTLLAAAAEEFAEIREKMSRAAQLRHPNLLAIAGAGVWFAPSGEELLYLASEATGETLADACRSGPLAADAVIAMLNDVLKALAFLHGQGLVYRGLEPQTIVRVSGTWKLADYGRLHRAGTLDPHIGQFLNGSQYTPPEAYSGLVLPAWDVWGIASVVLESLTGKPEEGVAPPPPFDAVVRGCREPSPEARLDLNGLQAILGPPKIDPVVAATPAAADGRWEAPPGNRSPAPRRRYWIPAVSLAVLVLLGAILGGAYRAGRQVPPAALSAPSIVPLQSAASRPLAGGARPGKHKAEIGRADFASDERHAQRTASGERFSSASLTAAHRTYPLGSLVRVTNLKNGRSVVVRINDRGIHRPGYVIRVTRLVAEKLKFASAGSTQVRLDRLN